MAGMFWNVVQWLMPPVANPDHFHLLMFGLDGTQGRNTHDSDWYFMIPVHFPG
jgi:hypothetical protein